MTYSTINVHLYNVNLTILISRLQKKKLSELLLSFWFLAHYSYLEVCLHGLALPGAKGCCDAQHTIFAATEELVVWYAIYHLFSDAFLLICMDSYSGDSDTYNLKSSFVYRSTKRDPMFWHDHSPRHESVGRRYCRPGSVSESVLPFYISFFWLKNTCQEERIPLPVALLQQSEHLFWRWSVIPRYRRWLKQNLTKSLLVMEEHRWYFFPCLPLGTRYKSLSVCCNLCFSSGIQSFMLTVFLLLLNGSL